MGRGRCLRPVRAGLCSGLCSEGGPSAPAFPACVLLPSSGSHTVTGVLCRGKRPKWGPEWPVQEWGRGARATHPRGSLPWEAGWPQRDTGGPSSGPGALVPGEAVRTLARGGGAGASGSRCGQSCRGGQGPSGCLPGVAHSWGVQLSNPVGLWEPGHVPCPAAWIWAGAGSGQWVHSRLGQRPHCPAPTRDEAETSARHSALHWAVAPLLPGLLWQTQHRPHHAPRSPEVTPPWP